MKRVCQLIVLIAALAATGCQSSQPLFNGRDLSGWQEVGSNGAWSVENGVLKCSGEKTGYAWLSTEKKYGDFELTLEWRIPENGNTGVFLRAPSREGRISQLGLEVQCKDDRNDKDLTDASGAVFSRIPASGRYAKPPGQWNHMKLTFIGRRLRIELNGHLVSGTDIDEFKPADPQWSMTSIPNEGYIGLQNHGDPVEFRNIRLAKVSE